MDETVSIFRQTSRPDECPAIFAYLVIGRRAEPNGNCYLVAELPLADCARRGDALLRGAAVPHGAMLDTTVACLVPSTEAVTHLARLRMKLSCSSQRDS